MSLNQASTGDSRPTMPASNSSDSTRRSCNDGLLVQEAKSLPPESACAAYEAALDLYGGDLLERPDVPPYRWMDEGPRLVDLRVKYAAMEHQARRRLADLLAAGAED